jgi:2-octaprenyl-6-methoxyphenol hydroxylase
MSKTPICLIAGSGSVGLMLALRLKQKLGDDLHVHICDPGRAVKKDKRAYALNREAVSLLHEAGLWDDLSSQAQSVHSMRIGDSSLDEPIRPVFLNFAEDDEHRPLAYVLEGYHLQEALKQASVEAGVLFSPVALTGFSTKARGICAQTSDGKEHDVSLLVAADGLHSSLREEARIGLAHFDYPQKAVVATLRHEYDHEGAAVQHFLPGGPFALLPLPPEEGVFRSSLVWSETKERADHLVQARKAEFEEAVIEAAGGEWGAFTLEDGPSVFPLSLGLARRWTQPFFALLGDAAHHIHPLAGQGLNLGLQDAGVLADEVAGSMRLGCAPASRAVLAAYERKRRPAAIQMAALTTGLNSLFSNDSMVLRFLRQTGLGLTQQAGPVRRFLMKQAAGG